MIKTILSKIPSWVGWVCAWALAILFFPLLVILSPILRLLNMGGIAAEGERYKRENAEGRAGPLEPKTIPLKQTEERPRIVKKKTFKEKLSNFFLNLLLYSFIIALMLLICWVEANDDNPIIAAIPSILGVLVIGWLIYIWLKDP